MSVLQPNADWVEPPFTVEVVSSYLLHSAVYDVASSLSRANGMQPQRQPRRAPALQLQASVSSTFQDLSRPNRAEGYSGPLQLVRPTSSRSLSHCFPATAYQTPTFQQTLFPQPVIIQHTTTFFATQQTHTSPNKETQHYKDV